MFICVHLWIRSLTVNTEAKFARIAALRPSRRGATARVEASAPGDGLAGLLGAAIHRNSYGEYLSLRQWYATPEMCSPDASALSLLLPQLNDDKGITAAALNPAQWLFLDTETTGLAGGTGTYAFMVGIAWWDAGGLQVEQFFLRDLNEEHSLLLELSERMKQRPVLVTFNGKCFDWPLLETRYRMTRSIPAFVPSVHLDLLHPARQLWRLRLGSVRLKDLERHVLRRDGCALDWSRHDDIDSSLIPQMYFDYLRGGTVEPIAGIFRHNQMDLRGLAALAGRIFALLGSGAGSAAEAPMEIIDPIEALGLSRILRKRGERTRARVFYEAALLGGLPGSVQRLAQRELAQLAKTQFDYPRAVSLWSALREPLGREARNDPAPFLPDDARKAVESSVEAAEQLAIYYEHRAKQSSRALSLVRETLREVQAARRAGTIATEYEARTRARLTRRLARLEQHCAAEPLFQPSRRATRSGERQQRHT